MKIYKYVIALLFVTLAACTSDFTKINTNPNAITASEASARYFITNVQFRLFAPDRYPYWRAQLIHADRYSGQACFGHHGSWWSDELSYSYNSAYTDAAWDWLEGFFGSLDNFQKLTEAGGEFENELMYATSLIIKGLYFQMYTDAFGEIPYSDVGNQDVVLPKFDTQVTIYKGIINDLNTAMSIIGDNTVTGDGVENLGENDIYYQGDLQKWKKMANTLKLRLAIRAYGAAGNDFSDQAITEALAAPLLETEADNCLMEKDNIISQWGSACYGDVWYNFGAGSDWTLGKEFIDYLRNNEDPRLSRYAKPAQGGTVRLSRPDQANDAEGWEKFPARVQFLLSGLEAAGVQYETVEDETGVTVTVPENTYYVGQPVRLGAQIKNLVRFEFFSSPAEIVIQRKNEGKPIFPEIVMTTAEAYFLRATASVLGFNAGDAQEHFQNGIRHAMKIWGVGDSEIDDYLSKADLAMLTGNQEADLEKIAIQRWLAAYTDGFEAWSIVRKWGAPQSLAQGVSDLDIYGLGDINGAYPQRMQYGNSAKNKNGANLNEALGRQGPDRQDVKLWWAK